MRTPRVLWAAIFRRSAFAIIAAMLFSMAGPASIPAAQAEVPPLSVPQLTSAADLIVRGHVVEVNASTVTPSWADRDDIGFFERFQIRDTFYAVAIEVDDLEKGSLASGEKRIVFHGWAADRRPSGWAGPGGTLPSPPRAGDRVKAYLKRGKDGWELFSRSGLIVQ